MMTTFIRAGLCGIAIANSGQIFAQPSPNGPVVSVSPAPEYRYPGYQYQGIPTVGARGIPASGWWYAARGIPTLPSNIDAYGNWTTLPYSTGDIVTTAPVQPIFHLPGSTAEQMRRIEGVVERASALGTVAPNYGRIADTLEKGFPNISGNDSLGYQARKKVADDKIRLAANDPDVRAQDLPPAQQPNGQDNGLKQTMDEINKIFKTQADLIRSIDIGSVRRTLDPAVGPNGPIYPNAPFAPGVAPNPDPPRVVITGRTGLELTLVPTDVLDFLKIPRDQGLVVFEVYPSTPAELAGYKKGDILLELNGRRVPSNLMEFLDRVMSTVKNDTPVTGVVHRGLERMKVGDMKVTDRRVVPPLPNEQTPDLRSIIRVVPGLNSEQVNIVTSPEYRVIRNGLTTEIVPYYPLKK